MGNWIHMEMVYGYRMKGMKKGIGTQVGKGVDDGNDGNANDDRNTCKFQIYHYSERRIESG